MKSGFGNIGNWGLAVVTALSAACSDAAGPAEQPPDDAGAGAADRASASADSGGPGAADVITGGGDDTSTVDSASGDDVVEQDTSSPPLDAPVVDDQSVPGDAVAGNIPNTVVLDGNQLAQAKQKLAGGDMQLQGELSSLVALADAALTAGPWSVMDKTSTPASNDKHDYMSLSRYYWPTPGAANGCPYIHKDGQTNPACATNAYDHASRHAAMDALYDLSLAWYFTGQTKYSDRAELVARTWFLNAATAMNPNVNFGEGVPCLRNGAATGVLNWTELIGEALDGIAILDSGAPGWTSADQMQMHTWLTSFLNWLQTNSLATQEDAAANNHGTWYDTGVSAILVYLGQTSAAKTLVTTSETKRLATQINADGSQPQELSRTNSWGYSNWNLEGFCRLASTAKHVGVDLWSYTAPNGGTLAKAVDYLINGAEHGQSVWTSMQIGPFDQTWPVPLFHAAADFANDMNASAALPMLPMPTTGGDLWSLVSVCREPAIQVN